MNRRGFSLIEALVVLGIVATVSLWGWPNFKIGQKHLALRAEARNLLSNLRTAQGLAIAQQTKHAITIINGTADSYQLIRCSNICTNDTVLLKNHSLANNITWATADGFVNNQIIFNPTGAVTQSGVIQLTNDNSQTITIEIKPSGYVRIN